MVDEISDTAVGPTDNKECDNTPEGPKCDEEQVCYFLNPEIAYGVCVKPLFAIVDNIAPDAIATINKLSQVKHVRCLPALLKVVVLRRNI